MSNVYEKESHKCCSGGHLPIFHVMSLPVMHLFLSVSWGQRKKKQSQFLKQVILCPFHHSRTTVISKLESEPCFAGQRKLNLLEYSICQAYCFWNTLASCHRMSKDVLWYKYLNFWGKISGFSPLVEGTELKVSLFSIYLC